LTHLLLEVVGWEADDDKVRSASCSARGNDKLDFICCDPDETTWVPAIRGAVLMRATSATLLDSIKLALEPGGKLLFGPDLPPPDEKLAALGFSRRAGDGLPIYELGASA